MSFATEFWRTLQHLKSTTKNTTITRILNVLSYMCKNITFAYQSSLFFFRWSFMIIDFGLSEFSVGFADFINNTSRPTGICFLHWGYVRTLTHCYRICVFKCAASFQGHRWTAFAFLGNNLFNCSFGVKKTVALSFTKIVPCSPQTLPIN